MRVLIVGAGSVGQVYAHHLQRGGAQVAFLVKPRYLAELVGRADAGPAAGTDAGARPAPGHGLPVTRVGRRDLRQILTDYTVFTTQDGHSHLGGFDQVWLCVSSPALQGQWLPDLLGAVGDAAVFSFQSSLGDADRLRAQVPAERLAFGLIPFMAWWTPLPGSDRPPGEIAWWLPPLSRCPFSGPGVHVAPAVAALSAGGLPAGPVGDAAAQGMVGSSLLLPQVASMELVGWSWARYRAETAALGARASREALGIVAAMHGLSTRGAALVARAWVLRLGTRLARQIVPHDAEAFFQLHFSKVGDQTALNLSRLIAGGSERGLPTAALTELHDRLVAVRASGADAGR